MNTHAHRNPHPQTQQANNTTTFTAGNLTRFFSLIEKVNSNIKFFKFRLNVSHMALVIFCMEALCYVTLVGVTPLTCLGLYPLHIQTDRRSESDDQRLLFQNRHTITRKPYPASCWTPCRHQTADTLHVVIKQLIPNLLYVNSLNVCCIKKCDTINRVKF